MPRKRKIILSKRDQIFLDSNFVVALIDAADVHHQRSVRLLEKIGVSNAEIFLSDVLINEVLSVLAKRCASKGRREVFSHLAVLMQQLMYQYPILSLYELVPQNYTKLVSMMVHSQGELNFHDCLIVLFLKELPEVSLVTFDKDFESQKEIRLFS